MQFAYNLSGIATPHIKKFQIGEAMATQGVPVVAGGAGNEGVALATTITASDCAGITLDTQATLLTAQQTDNSDPARQVSVIVNPDAVFSAKLSGAAASDTALADQVETTGSATGLVVTTGAAWNAPTYDEGVVWGLSGANAGIVRKITSVGATSGTVTLAFPVDIDIGDIFLRAPFAPSPEDQFVQLTTALDEIDASVAVDTDNNNFRILELTLRDAGGEGRNNSFAKVMIFDHLFAAGGSI